MQDDASINKPGRHRLWVHPEAELPEKVWFGSLCLGMTLFPVALLLGIGSVLLTQSWYMWRSIEREWFELFVCLGVSCAGIIFFLSVLNFTRSSENCEKMDGYMQDLSRKFIRFSGLLSALLVILLAWCITLMNVLNRGSEYLGMAGAQDPDWIYGLLFAFMILLYIAVLIYFIPFLVYWWEITKRLCVRFRLMTFLHLVSWALAVLLIVLVYFFEANYPEFWIGFALCGILLMSVIEFIILWWTLLTRWLHYERLAEDEFFEVT